MPTIRISPDPVPGAANRYQNAGVDSGKRFASADIVNGPGETTTHFSVFDKHGNMVSYTNTIENGFAAPTLDALRARGYTIGTPGDIGSVQAWWSTP